MGIRSRSIVDMRMPEQEVTGPGHSLDYLLLGLIAIAAAKESGLQVFVKFSARNKLQHFNRGKGVCMLSRWPHTNFSGPLRLQNTTKICL